LRFVEIHGLPVHPTQAMYMETSMKSHTLPTLMVTLGVATFASAQECRENICFVDRGASGEISLGPRFGSVSVIDYDRDGYVDLLVCDYTGYLVHLYRNIPDAMREGARTFEDVTTLIAPTFPNGVGATPPAALVADFDNDGWSDVYFLGLRNGDSQSGRLYRNDHGVFVDVTAHAGVAVTGDLPESASWVDFDLDGFVDLMVASRLGSVHPLRLLRNQRDGTFVDVSSILPSYEGWSRMYAHTWTDFDADGYPDMLGIPTTGPMLLHNIDDGNGGRRFVDAAPGSSFDLLGPAPMGISAGDYDNDGDFDFALSNGLIGVYYENTTGSFARRELCSSIFAWGVLWLDVNNDGLLDHYQAGSTGRSANFNKLFLNRGGGVFDDVSVVLNDLYVGSQCATQLDFNNDGRQDIVTVNPYSSFVSVSDNVSATGNHWINVRVRGDGVRVNGDAIGAIVRVTTGNLTQSRQITSGSSTISTEDLRAHFGVGVASSVDRIEVIWPRRGTLAARTQTFEGPFVADQFMTLHAPCVADFNRDGGVHSQDFFDFVAAFLNGDPLADIDTNDAINSQDFFEFLRVFFEGCA
jgi:enediyne biosynthesis protein E4